jgi:HD superfamily phosphodiesterase
MENWSEIIQKLFLMAEPYFGARGDALHTRVAHQYALGLLKGEGGEEGIVEPAVILHDVGWSQLAPEEIKLAYGVRAKGENAASLNRVHEREGARIARHILEEIGYNADFVEQITEIIAQHDSGKQARTLEEALVKDADKLWRVSQLGFWSEARRQNLAAEERFRWVAARCESWFFTKTARREAEKELNKRRREVFGEGGAIVTERFEEETDR